MTPYDVYPLFPIALSHGRGAYIWDTQGKKYLDLYGGHAVISLGHSHPHFVKRVTEQLQKLAFYSNSIENPIQNELAALLGELSGYPEYALFLSNSGAEANENALKLASFHTGRERIVAFKKGFHGRTSLAVAATDNPKIVAPVNRTDKVSILPWEDIEAVEKELATEKVAAVIIEGIQGVGGVMMPSDDFLRNLEAVCHKYGTLLILDEIQSGYGRSGRFFAHQYAGIKPDLITTAKGMGNGFPIGGLLIRPGIKPWHGMLGTTFGGSHLACAAGLAVLEAIKDENLMENARLMGAYMREALSDISDIQQIRGRGLMVGLAFDFPIEPLRARLLNEAGIFTGSSYPNVLRILPPLSLDKAEIDIFVESLASLLEQEETAMRAE